MSGSGATPLKVDGLSNIRDLGGLMAGGGRTIRLGCLIRSDNLASLTDVGREVLMNEVTPRTVIDLRMDFEVDRDAYELDGSVERLRLPMLPLSGLNQAQIDAGACSNLVDDYMGQIDVNGAYIAGVIRIVAQRANHPVIVHCTAGKDRTGVVTAMVLEILGISHQDIADDYHATAANMGPILAKIRSSAHFQENGLAAAPDWLFAADTATMAAFLVRMTDTYGSAHEWALQNGISAEELADLKTEMLGEGAESA